MSMVKISHFIKTYYPLLPVVMLGFILHGCGHRPAGTAVGVKADISATTSNINTSEEAPRSSIDKAMNKALAEAQAQGNSQDVISVLAQMHNRNPDDPQIATRYGRALRNDDQFEAAIDVLRPFDKPSAQNEEPMTELAMAQIALGQFSSGADTARDILAMNPKNPRAYLALGTAQDALGNHAQAEESFRQGMKYWRGDATAILNNLALNLASQGHLKESLALIEKAQTRAPHNMELERNRRIIATLLEVSGPQPPAPPLKPITLPPEENLHSQAESDQKPVTAQNNQDRVVQKIETSSGEKSEPKKREVINHTPPKTILKNIKFKDASGSLNE